MDEILFCDYCGDVFLCGKILNDHIDECHPETRPAAPKPIDSPVKEEQPSLSSNNQSEEKVKKKKRAGPASRVKRAPSSSDEDEKCRDNEKKENFLPTVNTALPSTENNDTIKEVKKKVKAGPASRVKRPRSSSPEEEEKYVKTESSGSGIPQSGEQVSSDVKSTDVDLKKESEGDTVKKKPKAGPASKVKRKRSSSSESEEKDRSKLQKVSEGKEDKKSTSLHEAKCEDSTLPKPAVERSKIPKVSDVEHQASKKSKPKEKKSKKEKEKVESKPKPALPKKNEESGRKGGGLLGQSEIRSHDNDSGPVCPKCERVCKDTTNLKNHFLSHFYQEFYVLLPGSKPFACPECGKENRDKITLLRHYAFSHNKTEEVTGVDFAKIFGERKRSPNKKPAGTKNSPTTKKSPVKKAPSTPKQKDSLESKNQKAKKAPNLVLDSDDDSSDDEDLKKLMERANKSLSGISSIAKPKPKDVETSKEKIIKAAPKTEGHERFTEDVVKTEEKRKEKKKDRHENKHKHSKHDEKESRHKEHKHKEKKHKKDKDRDKNKDRHGADKIKEKAKKIENDEKKDQEEKPMRPLEKLFKELSPDTSSIDSVSLEKEVPVEDPGKEKDKIIDSESASPPVQSPSPTNIATTSTQDSTRTLKEEDAESLPPSSNVDHVEPAAKLEHSEEASNMEDNATTFDENPRHSATLDDESSQEGDAAPASPQDDDQPPEDENDFDDDDFDLPAPVFAV